MVFKVDVGSGKHVRIQTARDKNKQHKGKLSWIELLISLVIGTTSIRLRSIPTQWSHVLNTLLQTNPKTSHLKPKLYAPGIIGKEFKIVMFRQRLKMFLELLLGQTGRQAPNYNLTQ